MLRRPCLISACRALAGMTASRMPEATLERSILKAIQTFEPRLEKARGVMVRVLAEQEMQSPNTVMIEISGAGDAPIRCLSLRL